MASISTGGGHGGKKSVDSEIPLVPFIDLLLCCIMFLLVTAVWNKLASLDANVNLPGNPAPNGMTMQSDAPLPLTVLIDANGYRVTTDMGDETRIGLDGDGAHDTAALREHLRDRRAVVANDSRVVVSADDGIQYAEVVETMDVFAGSGFGNVTIAGDL